MSKILIFAGTTEGRKLSECLVAVGIMHTVCVATEYGEIVLNEHPLRNIHCGRMNREEMSSFIQNGNYTAVVDATHPYATIVTENIKAAIEGMKIPYLRLKREISADSQYEKIRYFESNEDCVDALKETSGNILLTTGSKELAKYCAFSDVKSRLYVRVLPGLESLTICMEQGIAGKQIIAMQGPFTTQMNEAMIHQYGIQYLVTKQSGGTGGFYEKLMAAQNADIPVYVIGQRVEEYGYSLAEVCGKLADICGTKIKCESGFEIVLAGVGMGNRENLTVEVRQAIENADILLGAKRLIEDYQPRLEKKPFYLAEQIVPYLRTLQENGVLADGRKVVVLFSGDCGFYSGCKALYRALRVEIEEGKLDASVFVKPGISSVAYLAACLGESYQDAVIYSMHGKEILNLSEKIRHEKSVFLLMSGVSDMRRFGKMLVDSGLTECRVFVGYQLSYPEQQIVELTPRECMEQEKEGLYICFIKNPMAQQKMLTHGKEDYAFIRDKVPMTKEEVREVSICKLKLQKDAIVYDIGSGTGSIAMEVAGLSDTIKVYAIEKKEAAVLLIEKNKKQFQLENVMVVKEEAPDGLERLPMATHAFIGGSGGKLQEILDELYRINPKMRVVINAISMETICEIKEVISQYPLKNEDVVQMQVSRAGKVGNYHLMQAENPVWICSFDFCDK